MPSSFVSHGFERHLDGTIKTFDVNGARGTPPVIIYSHGGGWILGDFHTHEQLVRTLAAGTGATVVFAD